MLLGSLEVAYMKRKRWEARIQAVEMGKMLGELLGGKETRRRGDAGTRRRGETGTRRTTEQASAGEVLRAMGVTVRGKTR